MTKKKPIKNRMPSLKELFMREATPKLTALKGGKGSDITIYLEFDDKPDNWTHAQEYAHGITIKKYGDYTFPNILKHTPMVDPHGVRQIHPNEQDRENILIEVTGPKKVIEQWMIDYYLPYYVGIDVESGDPDIEYYMSRYKP